MFQNKVSVDLWSKSYVFSETKNKETYTIDYILLYHFFIKWKITLVIVTNLEFVINFHRLLSFILSFYLLHFVYIFFTKCTQNAKDTKMPHLLAWTFCGAEHFAYILLAKCSKM